MNDPNLQPAQNLNNMGLNGGLGGLGGSLTGGLPSLGQPLQGLTPQMPPPAPAPGQPAPWQMNPGQPVAPAPQPINQQSSPLPWANQQGPYSAPDGISQMQADSAVESIMENNLGNVDPTAGLNNFTQGTQQMSEDYMQSLGIDPNSVMNQPPLNQGMSVSDINRQGRSLYGQTDMYQQPVNQEIQDEIPEPYYDQENSGDSNYSEDVGVDTYEAQNMAQGMTNNGNGQLPFMTKVIMIAISLFFIFAAYTILQELLSNFNKNKQTIADQDVVLDMESELRGQSTENQDEVHGYIDSLVNNTQPIQPVEDIPDPTYNQQPQQPEQPIIDERQAGPELDLTPNMNSEAQNKSVQQSNQNNVTEDRVDFRTKSYADARAKGICEALKAYEFVDGVYIPHINNIDTMFDPTKNQFRIEGKEILNARPETELKYTTDKENNLIIIQVASGDYWACSVHSNDDLQKLKDCGYVNADCFYSSILNELVYIDYTEILQSYTTEELKGE